MSRTLDPQLADVFEARASQVVLPMDALSVDGARRLKAELSVDEGPPVGAVRDLLVEGPRGEIPLRIYRPESDPQGALVYYHGGGWVFGSIDSADALCRRLVRRTDCAVVSVEYRLAPEHPFPEPLDDAYAALEWVAANAVHLGVDAGSVCVGGDSAGGNLAAAVALRAREFDGPDLRGQLLVYPVLDHRFDRESYERNADGPLLTREAMEWYWEQYLRSPVDAANPYAAPLRADDLAGSPPATVVTAGFDPLCDEGDAYADRLDEAGADVSHRHYPSMAHLFLAMTEAVEAADDALDDVAADVRSWFE